MADDKSGPEYHSTTPLEKPDKVEIMFSEIKSLMNVNHRTVMHEFDGLKTRVSHLEKWKEESEPRLGRHSKRVENIEGEIKQGSAHDLEAQAKISQEIVASREELAKEVKAREELAEKVDKQGETLVEIKTETSKQTAMLTTIVDTGSRFFSNPIVRSIATIVGTAILVWLTAHLKH